MNTNKRLPSYKGISLVELLVAMAIGVTILNAIIQVYASNHKATGLISGVSSLQENSRIALSQLTQSLRLAGHFGGVTEAEDFKDRGSLAITGIGECDSDWVFGQLPPTPTPTASPAPPPSPEGFHAFQGYQGENNIGSVENFPRDCIPSDQYVPDSDILVVRYADPVGSARDDDLDNDKIYVRTSTGGGIDGVEFFLGSGKNSVEVGTGVTGVGTYNYQYRIEAYFLRPCSQLTDGACEDGIPTLVRYQLDGDELSSEAIAEGVEQLQIEYGLDTEDENGKEGLQDFVADTYETANELEQSDWGKVVSIRFSIVVRSELQETDYDDNNVYDLVDDYDYTPETELRSYRRKLYTKVVQLRNMSRG